MAFSILLYENDPIICRLLTKRLSKRFPEAYIRQAHPDREADEEMFSDITLKLVDERQFSFEDIRCNSETEDIISFRSKDGSLIDCRSVCGSLREHISQKHCYPSNLIKSNTNVRLLIPFAYIDERESFIKNILNDLRKISDMTIRIDLMSGIRMPSSIRTGQSYGSLTELLRRASDKDFTPEDILQYLNPDNSGCITPGRPDQPDDVFDCTPEDRISLIRKLIALSGSSDIELSAIVVVEGFHIKELADMCKEFNVIDVLLPSRMCDENTGFEEMLKTMSASLPYGCNFNVHYVEPENTGKEFLSDERAIHRP